MSVVSTKYVFGVKVYATESGLSQDTDIGLYVSAGVGQFRWSQYAVTASDTWKAGLITEGGIGEIGAGADFSLGGNVVQIDGLELSLVNIIGTSSLWKKLVDAGISLIGCKCEVIEFDTSVSPATQTIIYRGIVESAPSWDIGTYRFKISEPYYKRDVLIGELIDNSTNGNYPDAVETAGELVPISFGKLAKAKMLRTATKETPWANTDGGIFTGFNDESSGAYVFKIYSSVDGVTYLLYFGAGDDIAYCSGKSITDVSALLVGKHFKVIEGTNKGQYREISSVNIVDLPGATIQFSVKDYWETDLTTTEWVEIVDLKNNWQPETWKCLGFSDSNFNILTSNLELYIYDEYFYQIPQHCLKIYTTDSLNNRLVLESKFYKNSPNSIDSFAILPIENLIRLDAIAFANWGKDGLGAANVTRKAEGLFLFNESNPYFVLSEISLIGTPRSIIDKDPTTMAGVTYRAASSDPLSDCSYVQHTLYAPFVGTLPAYPSNFAADKIYLLVKCTYSLDGSLPYDTNVPYFYFDLMLRRFRGNVLNQITVTMAGSHSNSFGRSIDNFLREYYTDNLPSDNNGYFYQSDHSGAKSKYSLIEITADTKDIYDSYTGILIQMVQTYYPASVDYRTHYNFVIDMRIHEAAVIFCKAITLTDKIYTPFQGRIFNDTWAGGRTGREKTAANLIESIVDVHEHICRLENFTEEGATEEPGKAYAASALINTATTEGGHDYIGLDSVRDIPIRRQIFDESEARSGRIKESLCKQFFLCSYTNMSGQECLNTIHRRDSTPDVNITLNHILPGSLSSFEEVGVENIFCQPFVRYAKNSATGDFDGIIRITNVHKATYDSSYVSGYTGTEAETMWNLAHALYGHYRILTEPPSEMTDHEWIYEKEDAKDYLMMWLEWMGAYLTSGNVATVARSRRYSFETPYSVAMTIGAAHTPWFPSMRFDVTLPHQTAGSTLQNIVENIKFNTAGNKAVVSALCYDISEEIQYFVKDSYDSYAAVGWNDWQDTYSTKAEQPTNENDIQDSM